MGNIRNLRRLRRASADLGGTHMRASRVGCGIAIKAARKTDCAGQTVFIDIRTGLRGHRRT